MYINSVFLYLKRFVVLFFVFALFMNTVFAADWYVDSNADNDPDTCTAGENANDDNCTFRDAVSQMANGDTVYFLEDEAIVNTGGTYTLDDDNVTVDGTTGGYTVELDGNGAVAPGLNINADGVTVKGLYVYDFSGNGILVSSLADETTVEDVVLGLDPSETIKSNSVGIRVSGTDTLLDGVVSSGNDRGVNIPDTAQDITINNSKIGTDSTGTQNKGNTGYGIHILGGNPHNLNGDAGGAGGEGLTVQNSVISGNTEGIYFNNTAGGISGDVDINNNKIGVDITGDTAIANGNSGIDTNVSLTDGVNWTVDNNVISGNTDDGVSIDDGTSAVITNNYIGTDHDGDASIGNGNDGLFVDSGSVSIENNVISSNGQKGIAMSVAEDTNSVTIKGNKVGVIDDGTGQYNSPASNGADVDISGDIDDVTIGGSNPGDRNIFGDGIDINTGTGTGPVEVDNNYFGVGEDGSSNIGTGGVGVASSNDVDITNNVIGNSTGYGVHVTGGDDVDIVGNKIGTEADGVSDASILADGVRVELDSINNVNIEDNVVAATGPANAGIKTVSLPGVNSTTVTIKGNYIGVGGDGQTTTDLANNRGIEIRSGSVTIGGDNDLGSGSLGDGNVISNNTGEGVLITGSSVASANIFGNIVGLISDGTSYNTAAGNDEGIKIDSVMNSVVIGDPADTKRNIVSGNTNDGIGVGNAADVSIYNNYIGTDYDGISAVPNGMGILSSISSLLRIGNESIADSGNVISGNSGAGISSILSGNVIIQGNYIGVDATGETGLANNFGISSMYTSNFSVGGNDINDPAKSNVISGNGDYGIYAVGNNDNIIAGNYIGTDKDGDTAIPNYDTGGGGLPGMPSFNPGSGIFIMDAGLMGPPPVLNGAKIGGSGANTSWRNVIAGNEGAGIFISHEDGTHGLPVGGGQDWSTGYIQNNYLGVGGDGSTRIANGGPEIYVDNKDSTTAHISNINIGGSDNVINNSDHDSLYFDDIAANTIANYASLVNDNNWTATCSDTGYSYYLSYVSGVLNDSSTLPVCTVPPSGGGGSALPVIVAMEEGMDEEEFEEEKEIEEEVKEEIEEEFEEEVEEEVEEEIEEEVEERFEEEVEEEEVREEEIYEEREEVGEEGVEPEQETFIEHDDIDNNMVSDELQRRKGWDLYNNDQDEDNFGIADELFFGTDPAEKDICEPLTYAAVLNLEAETTGPSPLVKMAGPAGYEADLILLDENGNELENLGSVEFMEDFTAEMVPEEPLDEGSFQIVLEGVDGAVGPVSEFSVDLNAENIGYEKEEEEEEGLYSEMPSNLDIPILENGYVCEYLSEPRVTNLDGAVVNSEPLIRMAGPVGREYNVILVDGAENRKNLDSVIFDESYKAFLKIEEELSDGEYRILLEKVDEGTSGPEAKFVVDSTKKIKTPKMEIVEEEELLVRGNADPDVILFATWESVILSSVVLSDASQGEFKLDVPDELPEGSHEVLVYALNERNNIISNVTRLVFEK
ncbi:hypothetical protein GF366_01080 [Candidatus Peregrinibacteria bacterium]|nr:hypothetical protein [Candidatus Peregrinibacteria bacterium]